MGVATGSKLSEIHSLSVVRNREMNQDRTVSVRPTIGPDGDLIVDRTASRSIKNAAELQHTATLLLSANPIK